MCARELWPFLFECFDSIFGIMYWSGTREKKTWFSQTTHSDEIQSSFFFVRLIVEVDHFNTIELYALHIHLQSHLI